MSVLSLANKLFANDGKLSSDEASQLRDAAIDGPGVTVKEHNDLQRALDKYMGSMDRSSSLMLGAVLAQPVATKITNLGQLKNGGVLLIESQSIIISRPESLSLLITGELGSAAQTFGFSKKKNGDVLEITVGAVAVRPSKAAQLPQNRGASLFLDPIDSLKVKSIVVKDVAGKELARYTND